MNHNGLWSTVRVLSFHLNHVWRLFCSSMRKSQSLEKGLVLLPNLSFWTINHTTNFKAFRSLSFFFFAFPFSLPILLVQLLTFYQASFQLKNFLESVNQARNTCHGQAQGGKGKFSSEILTKISNCIFQGPWTQPGWFRYRWKGLVLLHNLSINELFLDQRWCGSSGTNAQILDGQFSAFQVSMLVWKSLVTWLTHWHLDFFKTIKMAFEAQ